MLVSPTSARPVYRGVAERSVYVAAAARGCGVGHVLLDALIESTEAAGIWTIQYGISPRAPLPEPSTPATGSAYSAPENASASWRSDRGPGSGPTTSSSNGGAHSSAAEQGQPAPIRMLAGMSRNQLGCGTRH